MLHPVLSHKYSVFSLLPFLVIHALVPAALLYYYGNLNWQDAFIDGLVYSAVMVVVGFSLWYPIGYGGGDNSISGRLVTNILVGVLSVIAWMLVSGIVSHMLLGHNSYYVSLAKQILPIRALWGIEHFMMIMVMYHFFVFYRDLEEKRLQEEVLKKQVKESELKSLKSQLNPHFLFNSLNSVSSLTITEPEKARRMITQLSDLLRYSLRNKHTELIPVCDELQNIRRYMDIEKVRFGDLLIYEEEVSEKCNQCRLPAMILQPLLENSIKHGLYESLDPVTVKIKCDFQYPNLEISISNNCDATLPSPKGEGMGLRSTANILRNMYNREGLLRTENVGDEFRVHLIIPQNS
ncbi:sensor histidine kinase [Alkalitalea saponilacus]|uniref:Histidine kinase n=1 Tax=Alkalitalea saponilacus TaxID=889453 RepID=A0A1T5CE24_9BACT|nr:histidine kinase [Alkalitalea saponilacus]ASB49834.1 histidine kinase [Alkalitalea saponilacus]SKB57669.1 Histidine kinase [Alkalitalea saponilacus]